MPTALGQFFERAQENYEKVANSEHFVILFDDNYGKDMLCQQQLAAAILLDKNIFVVAPTSAHVPDNLERVAIGVAYFDPEKSEEAGEIASKMIKDHEALAKHLDDE